MTETLADRIPAITDSLDKAKTDIVEHGVAILSGVLSPVRELKNTPEMRFMRKPRLTAAQDGPTTPILLMPC